ncbi:MAG: SixA phosphatase family protein [Myxococcota bacterium]
MGRLLLLRHGEAAPDGPGGRDHARPLSARGRASAGAVGAWLERGGVRPDRVLCSSAARARETWAAIEAVLGAADAPIDTRLEDDLYLASRPTLVETLARLGPGADCILVVGHNPGLSELAAWLDPDAREPIRMPPAALALFELRVDDWGDLAPGAAELQTLRLPETP